MPDNDVESYLENRRAIEQSLRATRVRNSLNKNGKKKIRRVDPTTSEINYTHAEVEFMNALQAYKQRTGRMFPTTHEVLGVIRELGYQKIGMTA